MHISYTKDNEGGLSFWTVLSNFLRTKESDTQCGLLHHFKSIYSAKTFFLDEELAAHINQRLNEQNAISLATNFRGQIIWKMPVIISKVISESTDESLTKT
jgi:hypothetical protein